MTHKKQLILIVDDDVINIELLSLVLGDGQSVVIATNGDEALQIARAEEPDLIILDIIMPRLNGFETLNLLKRDTATRKIPVIFITALDNHADEAKGLEMGAVDYISKPFNDTVVRARIINQLQLVRYREHLELLSSTDGLTGVYNRRHFDHAFSVEWRRLSRSQLVLSILYIDIDHFKLFNDHYGHLPGDECLKQISAVIKNSLKRAADFTARIGGEEFVCLLPETSKEGALMIAERILSSVQKLSIPHDESPVYPFVTVSIGGLSIMPTNKLQSNIALKQADEALYRAKVKGRNRIEFA
jgi:diguanylate cyclase (GGDEF)-like protein